VNVKLYELGIAYRLEALDLAGFDGKNLSRAALEGSAIYRPRSAAFTNELDFVVGMAVRKPCFKYVMCAIAITRLLYSNDRYSVFNASIEITINTRCWARSDSG
jgi:hypothetical protein